MELFLNLPEDASRQYLDAVSIFTALEQARKDAASVRGGLYWKRQGSAEYLVRTTPGGAQTSLGPRTPENETIFSRFHARKQSAEATVAALTQRLQTAQRLNKALRVGRTPNIVIDILNQLHSAQLADYFTVVGTHALYAYETEAGVRILNTEAMATQDVDLLWDTRKRIQFMAQLSISGSSMIGLLQKIDPSFKIRPSSAYTAVNRDGFEVDIIRREAGDQDPHPLRISEDDDDFWVVQAKRAGYLLSAPRLSSVLVSTTGKMARMNTIAPATFINFKRWMAEQTNRDPRKRPRDRLQAQIVETLVQEFLPQHALPGGQT